MIAASNHFPSLSRFVSTASVLLAVGATAACGASPDATPTSAPTPTPTPTPDPTSDRAIEIVESGAGAATVVFESGLGADWSPWSLVTSEVGARARTFAYSRPGYGQSEPSPDPRDAAHIVEDLRTLLTRRGFAPPYVLVGHSFGGAYMEFFAKAHPGEVMGVVLVDPRHRDFAAACEQAALAGCTIPAPVLASLPRVQIDEYEAFARTSDEIRALGTFGPYPVRVLTATSHGFAPEVETLWQSMLGSLAREATDGDQSVFVGAGHYLQLERAHEVAQVILSLIPTAER